MAAQRWFLTMITVLGLVTSACGSSADPGSATTDSSAGESTTTAGPQSENETTTTGEGSLGGLVGDLPKPCEFITAEEMSVVLGVEVTAEEEFGSDCFYIPVDGFGAGFDAHTSALAFSEEDCEFLLQTEPLLPGESVEPAPEYGDLASIILSSTRTEIQICSPKAAVAVTVSGDENMSSDDRTAAAREIVDLILGDL